MPIERWTDEFLDSMRQTADPLADKAIDSIFARGDRSHVQAFLDSLTRNEQLDSDQLPPEVREYLAALPVISEPDRPLIEEGQKLFVAHGPLIMLILACYSLPAAYAARKGVQVLYATSFLAERANRRLFQTAQMVIDVMTPGGLGPKGRGRVTAQKVRLMHAAIRRLLLTRPNEPWPADLGVPINQEDLAGTLTTFTHLIRDGLGRLGVTDEWPRGYLTVWQAVGRMMGLVEDLIPATPDEATALTEIIQRRQVEASPEGRAMTKALLEMLQGHCPYGLKSAPAACMRIFLPPEVADGLGVPRHRFEQALLRVSIRLGELFSRSLGHRFGAARLHAFGFQVVKMLVKAELGFRRPAFRIPTELHDAWQLSKR